MASAASLWNTGAIGIAVAFNRFEIAIALSLLNFVTLYLVGRLQKSVEKLNDNEVKDNKGDLNEKTTNRLGTSMPLPFNWKSFGRTGE
jgi:uncharacterized membrane protein YhiD involved in acid resistance